MGCGASAQAKYDTSHGTQDPEDMGHRQEKNGEGPPLSKDPINVSDTKVHSEIAPTSSQKADEGSAVSGSAPAAEAPVSERALAFLANVPVLQSLDKTDLPLLAEAMKTTSYSCGNVIISQGSRSDKLFIILSGTAEVVLRQDSRENKLVTLAAGDYFGEQELLHEDVARATVRVLGTEDLITYSITREEFCRLGLHEKLRLPKRRAMVNLREAGPGGLAQSLAPAKKEADLKFISTALRANAYLPSFCELTDGLASELATMARLRTVVAGEVLMKQGDLHGACFYIVQLGAFSVYGIGRHKSQRSVLAGTWEARAEAGDSFGELELLYSFPCAATVTAVEQSKVWAITSSDFSIALEHALTARFDGYAEVLRGVDIFKGLYSEELRALAATLTEVTYKNGDNIITQGDVGDTCFVLIEGEIAVLKNGVEADTRRVGTRAAKKAELFGEKELLHPSPRAATVQVISESASVLALDKVSFELVLEPLNDILYAVEASGESRKPACKDSGEQLQKSVKRWSNASASVADRAIDRANLRLLGNLGSGAFGSVELAEEQGTGQQFALKRVLRSKLTESRERRQILSEKTILSMIQSPFLVRLYGTYRDATALSFLLELVPGGDLYHAYCRYNCYGNLECAQFYTAGIVLALEHLHERRIMHRDLKPENVLLDGKGWPKLTDFGIAKLCVGKTFTRCGTPNYVAPEILTEVGHGMAVDWWSLGVLMYEMMAACTPFESVDGDILKTCRLSTLGIPSPDAWFWPDGFGENLPRVISALLQPNPLKRLPMQSGGMLQLKAHPWFHGFDWAEFQDQILPPPITPKVLNVETLKPSKHDQDWISGQLPDTDWDAGF